MRAPGQETRIQMGTQSTPRPLLCTVVAVDSTCFYYRVCAVCEKALPDNSTCKFCDYKAFNPGSSGSKRVYRILLSIASESKVMVVICFDRAARVLFGCSADDFFNFAKFNPFSAEKAGRILVGEMLKVTLSTPKSGHAQHLRVTSVVPLRSDFCPVIETLRKLYKSDPSEIAQRSLTQPFENEN
ncbi:uncharacterized protein [Aristolochia californica]|uniref:uncharacterized protein n=1 Tax=Aristolochia californica TaxID=171875 RepID=UPI0035E0A3C7